MIINVLNRLTRFYLIVLLLLVLTSFELIIAQVFISHKNILSSNDQLAEVTGSIRNRKGLPVEAGIKLGNDSVFSSDFQFALLPGIYQLCPRRDDNPLMGVTTADIVRIQRHILGIESFTNSYAYLAADVNQSNTLTAADVTEIRRLVLGVIADYTKVPSWIFVPKDSTFPDIVFPSVSYFKTYCRHFEIGAISNQKIDFIAIKMGDVTDNAAGHNYTNTENRTIYSPMLSYSTEKINPSLLSTTFKLAKEIDLAGLQFTLTFNPDEFDFYQINNGNIQLTDDQYTLKDLAQGKIHIAWDQYPLNKTDGATGNLFSIIWKKKKSSDLGPVLDFDPKGIPPLLIDQALNELDLSLKSETQDISKTIRISINQDNDYIYIQGQQKLNSNAFISIMDISGRVLSQETIELNEGIFNKKIKIPESLNGELYFINVHTETFYKTFKFIKFN